MSAVSDLGNPCHFSDLSLMTALRLSMPHKLFDGSTLPSLDTEEPNNVSVPDLKAEYRPDLIGIHHRGCQCHQTSCIKSTLSGLKLFRFTAITSSLRDHGYVPSDLICRHRLQMRVLSLGCDRVCCAKSVLYSICMEKYVRQQMICSLQCRSHHLKRVGASTIHLPVLVIDESKSLAKTLRIVRFQDPGTSHRMLSSNWCASAEQCCAQGACVEMQPQHYDLHGL